jgi:hypothetical protein
MGSSGGEGEADPCRKCEEEPARGTSSTSSNCFADGGGVTHGDFSMPGVDVPEFVSPVSL